MLVNFGEGERELGLGIVIRKDLAQSVMFWSFAHGEYIAFSIKI